MKRYTRLAFGVLAIAAVAAFAMRSSVLGWLENGGRSGEAFRLGAYDGDVGALVWIAHDRGLFRQVGLNVEVTGYPSGKEAADALRAGSVDVATASEYVVAARSFDEADLRILGSIAFYRNKALVARRDHGIREPADLKGKRIGVTSPSGAEYSLAVLLALYGLTVKDVELARLSPGQIVDAIGRGEIDAAITWQPHAGEIERKLAQNGVSFDGSGLDVYLLLVTRQETTAKAGKPLTKLLRALNLAADWVRDHPQEAQRYIATRFKVDESYVIAQWPRMRLDLEMPQELLTAMDSEARWLAAQGDKAKTIPDFTQFVRPTELLEVAPDAVTMVIPNVH